jgi:hypothetical protein
LVEAERALDLADFLEYLGHFACSQDGREVVAKDDEGLEDWVDVRYDEICDLEGRMNMSRCKELCID